MRRLIVLMAIVLGLPAVWATGAAADMPAARDAGPVVDSGKTRSRLIPAGDHVILHLSPEAGWHTYWTNPGDSGMATSITVAAPNGAEAGPIQWPVPDRIEYGPLVNFGYSGDVYLPIRLDDVTPGEEVTARADWLVCEEICIPEGADLTVTMGADNTALMQEVRARLPKAGPDGAFETADGTLRMAVPWPQDGAAEPQALAVFPYEDGLIDNAAKAGWAVTDGQLVAVVDRGPKPVPANFEAVLKLTTADGESTGYRIAFAGGAVPAVAGLAGGSGVEIASPGAGGAASLPFSQALLFAFVGGLILNLMPCVFPVLSMKAMAIARSSGQAAAERRMEGLAYTGGVLVSFAVVAGVLMALRAGGQAIGWGFQLQSPVFVTFMAFILFTMGLSFSGVFSIGGAATGLGQGLTEKRGHTGAFFTGALATLVATPCTAPFMAGALGTALLLPPVTALPLFLMLGLGLAFPILVISFSPAVGRLLPKPGDWMVTFRQFLAFLLYATVVWLLWVLGRQVGVDGLAAALFGLVLIAFVVWLLPTIGRHRGPSRWLRGAGAAAGVLLLVASVYAIGRAPVGGYGGAGGEEVALSAEAYSPERLQEHLDAGRAVFVNFTADWCITCLANERVALRSDAVRDAFAAQDIRYIKGDWTNRDPRITEVLENFGRSGVPLYLYYPPGPDSRDGPVVLPQILTPGSVVEAIEGAAPARAARLSPSESTSGG